MDTIHPATAAILRHFEYDHLAPELRGVSQPFSALAHELVHEHELGGAELTTGLRKLLEAKDCAVRAKLEQGRTADASTGEQ